MKFCPYCGADLLKEDAAFCAECGKKLSVAEEAPSPAHEADSQHNAKPSKQKTPKKDSRKRKKSKQKKVQEPPLPEIEGGTCRGWIRRLLRRYPASGSGSGKRRPR